jgi:hypothetical protein
MIIRALFLFFCTAVQVLSAATIYVDNSVSKAGDGSKERPFNTLVDAQKASLPGDVIYVNVGDGTSRGMDRGFVLKDKQSLIGVGEPVISNGAGYGITLANHNSVTGLHIDSSGNWGIYGRQVNDVTLTDNRISHPLSGGGVGIFNGSGAIEIANIKMDGDPTSSGIRVENRGTAAATVTIKESAINNFHTGIVLFAYESSSIISKIIGNEISNTKLAGMDIDAFDRSVSDTVIDNNRIHNHAQNGIIAFSGADTINPSDAVLHTVITRNKISECSKEGIVVATGNKGRQVAIITDNQLSKNGGVAGIVVETSQSKQLGDMICLRLQNNVSTNGFTIINFPGNSFLLEPVQHNTGMFRPVGTITPVAAGTCP